MRGSRSACQTGQQAIIWSSWIQEAWITCYCTRRTHGLWRAEQCNYVHGVPLTNFEVLHFQATMARFSYPSWWEIWAKVRPPAVQNTWLDLEGRIDVRYKLRQPTLRRQYIQVQVESISWWMHKSPLQDLWGPKWPAHMANLNTGHFLLLLFWVHTEDIFKELSWGWRAGSAVKNTERSSEGSEFKSQQPLGWFTTIHNKIWHLLLECLKTATVYLHIINK